MLSDYIKYASFVSKSHNYAYIATPKAACTYFKTLIAKIEGYSLQNTEDYTIKETRPSQFIHWRKEISIPTLHDVVHSLDVTSEHDCFLFAVVRNPYSRLFSAWASKIAEREPNIFDRYQGKAGFPTLMPRSERDIPVYFEAFLTYLYEHEYPNFGDDHWNIQARLLRPDQLRYSFIGKMEEMSEAVRRFQHHLLQFNILAPIIPPINDSLIKYNQDYITDRSRDLIKLMYQEDFETFGYSMEMPKVNEKSYINFDYLSGICDRNARIGYLHDVANKKQQELLLIQSTCDSLQDTIIQEREQRDLVSQQLETSNENVLLLERLLAEAKNASNMMALELRDAVARTEQLTNHFHTCRNDYKLQLERITNLEHQLSLTNDERDQLRTKLHDWSFDPAPRQCEDGPTVYITTPVLNAVSTIDRTIMSIVTQPGPFRIRYHVQDGGSTDGTLEILQAWQRRLATPSPLMRCQGIDFSYTSKADAGLYDAVAKAFARLDPPEGAFMGWLNADDVLLGNALSTICLAQDSAIEWLGGATYVIDEKDCTFLAGLWNYPRDVIRVGGCDGHLWPALQQVGQFFRKRLWDAAGGFAPGLRLAADWDLWRRFAAFAPMVQAPWPLAASRKRPGQLSERFHADYQAEVEAAQPAHLRGALMSELQSRGFETLSVQRFRISQGRAEACLQPCTGFSPLFYSGPEGQTLSEVAAESIRRVAALQADVAALQGWGRAEAALREEYQLRVDILRTTLAEERHAWKASPVRRLLAPLLPAVATQFPAHLPRVGVPVPPLLSANLSGGQEAQEAHSAPVVQPQEAWSPVATSVFSSALAHFAPPRREELFARVNAALPALVVVPCVEQALRTGSLPEDRPWVGFLHTAPDAPEAWRELLGNAPEELRRLFGAEQWRRARASCVGLATFSAWSARYWQDVAGLYLRHLPVPVAARTQKWSGEAFRAEPQKRLWQAGSGPQRRHAIDILDARGWSRIRICADSRQDLEFHARERQLLLERHILSASQMDSAQRLYQDEIPEDLLLSGVGLAHYYCSSVPETILRCLESATPVLVNPVASVVECLGHDYPLYYRSYPEAEALLADDDTIIRAHRHLLKRLEAMRDLESAVAEIIAPWK